MRYFRWDPHFYSCLFIARFPSFSYLALHPVYCEIVLDLRPKKVLYFESADRPCQNPPNLGEFYPFFAQFSLFFDCFWISTLFLVKWLFFQMGTSVLSISLIFFNLKKNKVISRPSDRSISFWVWPETTLFLGLIDIHEYYQLIWQIYMTVPSSNDRFCVCKLSVILTLLWLLLLRQILLTLTWPWTGPGMDFTDDIAA